MHREKYGSLQVQSASGVKRTCRLHCEMSAFDPKRTSPWRECMDLHRIERRRDPLEGQCSDAVQADSQSVGGARLSPRLTKRQPHTCPVITHKNKLSSA